MSVIFVINSGSSSVKYLLIQMPKEFILSQGVVEEIGTENTCFSYRDVYQQKKQMCSCQNHQEAIKVILDYFIKDHIIQSLKEIHACGHRIAHGGEEFTSAVIINKDVEKKIVQLSMFAPMHNAINLEGYRIMKTYLSHAAQIAVFDTAFHHTLSKDTYIYPIPYHYYHQHGLRKYGFHGTSFQYATMQARQYLGQENSHKMIICHLGNGASLAAILDGKSLNTSMGMTPLGGIMMGTRCGDIDPSLLLLIAKVENKTLEEVMNELQYNSGLKGVSGMTHDMRIIEEKAHQGDERCQIAIQLYVKRIVDTIAAYYFQLGGLDALVFTGGIGENSSYIRDIITQRLNPILNVSLDKTRNQQKEHLIRLISSPTSLSVLVVCANEELMISRETYQLI